MEELAETLPLHLGLAVQHINWFLKASNSHIAEGHRKIAVQRLELYKRHLIGFYFQPQHSFLLEYRATLYPNVVFHHLHNLVSMNKNYQFTHKTVLQLIEILENAKTSN